MCKYCENGDSIYYDEHGKDIINEVVIEDDNTLTICINGSVEVGETYCVVLDIDYCPKCGKKLVDYLEYWGYIVRANIIRDAYVNKGSSLI